MKKQLSAARVIKNNRTDFLFCVIVFILVFGVLTTFG